MGARRGDATDGGGWHDTEVLAPSLRVPPGWYADPYDPAGTRYWDGAAWTDRFCGPWESPNRTPPQRRSVLLAFVLAFFLGGLAFPYALPLPGWARLVMTVGLAVVLGWWLLLLVPLSWPFAIVGVPVLTAVLNPRR